MLPRSVLFYYYYYFFCYCVQARRFQWWMRDERGHLFISHRPSAHTHTSLTGLSSLLSQASLVLSVSLKRKKARVGGGEMEEGCQGRGEKGVGGLRVGGVGDNERLPFL